MDGPVTRAMENTGPTVKDCINDLLARGETTQGGIAKEVGISGAAISQWLKGNYAGDNAKIESLLDSWLLDRETKLAMASGMIDTPDFIPLSVCGRIESLLAYIQVRGSIGVVYGPPGIGKTTTITEYRNNHGNVWVHTSHPNAKGVRQCLLELAEEMGIKRVKTAACLSKNIIRRVRGTKGLIIIDDAQHVGRHALEELRYIHDVSRVGLVLCGNEHTYGRIAGDGSEAFAQFFSRIGKRLSLTLPSTEDATALAQSMGVDGKREIAKCLEIAATPESLRGMVEVIIDAHTMASGIKQKMDVRHINAAWQARTERQRRDK